MRYYLRLLRFIALSLAVLSITFSNTTQGQEPQPDYGKLDTALLGAVSSSLPGAQVVSEEVRGHIAQFTSYGFTDADGTEYIDGLIKTNGSLDGFRSLGVIVQSVVGEVVSARMPVETISQLTSLPNVEFIEASRQLAPFNDTSVPSTGATNFHNAGIDGTGAIVVVIDSDIDFTHNDFRNTDGTTRIKFLCDQTDAPQAGDATCPGLGSPIGGTLWTEAQINTHLDGGTQVRQTFTETHGSHVTGSAAGNDSTYGGMAPGADIIFVKSTLSSHDVVNSLSFIDQKAGELGLPYVINMSFGGHFGPHDGTDAMSVAINSLVGAGIQGKAVVAAAGNEGGSNIHASADLAGGNQTVQFDVPAGAVQFFVETWYDGNEDFTFGFTDSQGGGQINIDSGFSISQCVANYCFQVEHTFNQPEHNNSKQVELVITPPNGGSQITAPGTWTFTLSGTPTTNGVFHTWCNGSCTFPNGDTDFTVGEPAAAANAITVGALTNKPCWTGLNGERCYNGSPSEGDVAGFSSKGPTRDGRIKPDIVAPGEGIASALSSNGTVADSTILPGNTHFILQGTSMASPHVAGAVALYLAENPSLDAATILQTLKDTAIADAQTGTVPNNFAGYGKMNITPLGAVPPTLGITNLTVGEGVGDATLTISLSPAANQTVTVGYGTSDNTATGGEDYITTGGAVTFQTGETSKTVTVAIINDGSVEGDETFDVTLSNPTGGAQISTVNNISTVTIQDNDLAITKTADTDDGTCTSSDCSLREAIAAATTGATVIIPSGTYTLDSGSPLLIDESLTISGAGAGSTIIQANAVRNAASFEVVTIQSGIVAIMGVTIRHGKATNGGGIVVLTQDPVTITNSTISDNDSDFGGGVFVNTSGQLTITGSTLDGNSAGDGLGGGIFVNTSGQLTITNSTISGNLAGTGSGGGIYLNSGATLSATGSTISGNTAAGGGGLFNAGTSATITDSTLSNNSATGASSGGGAVFNNTGASLDITNSTISGNSAANFGGAILSFTSATLLNATVAFNTSGSGGAIFNNPPGGTLTLKNSLLHNPPDGGIDGDCLGTMTSLGHNLDRNGSCGLNQPTDKPSIADPNLGPLADNGGPTQTHPLLVGSAAIDAGDDTAAPATDQRGFERQGAASDIGAYEFLGTQPVYTLTANDISVMEGDGLIQFTISISPLSPLEATVDYSLTDGTATAVDDYELGVGVSVVGDTLTIPAGVSSATFSISIVDDALDENDETVIVTLLNPTNAEIDSASLVSVVTIVDNDPEPTIVASDITVDEGDGDIAFPVTLDAPSSFNVTFDFAISGSTATDPDDYGPPVILVFGDTVTIPAGATTTDIAVSIVDDTLDEPDEAFFVTLSNPVKGLLPQASVTSAVIIQDNDPIPTVSVSDATVNEGVGTVELIVSIDALSGRNVTVDYVVVNGSALNGPDYTGASSTASVLAGATSTTVSISILDDEFFEINETFTVVLSNPMNATLAGGGGSVGTVTIQDDDTAPTVSIQETAAITEGDGSAQTQVNIEVVLTHVLDTGVTVEFATSDGTATAGQDYVGATNSVTIAANTTSTTIQVAVEGDDSDENDETFVVTISNATSAVGSLTITQATSTVSILDDDGTIVAETALQPALDVDNVAFAELRVERLKYDGGELTFGSANGFQSFDATLTFDINAVEILDVRDVTEFAGNTTFDSTSTPGQLTISGSIAGAPADIGPLVLAKIVVRLTGSSETGTLLTVTSLQVTEATSGTDFNQQEQVSNTYRRGDVRVDGQVKATDRLFLTQCLLGLRDYGTAVTECHPINAASIEHDDPMGDMPTETDGLYISQLVVELRDPSFNLVP